MQIVRDPNKKELLAAKCIVTALDGCRDNTKKKIRFVAWLVSRWNMDIEEQQETIKMLYRLTDRATKRQNKINRITRSHSSTG